MENNNEFGNFLQNKLSVNELNLSEPDLSLIAEARKKVGLRKKQIQKPSIFLALLTIILNPQLKYLQVGLSTFIIAMCIFYVNDQPALSKNSLDSTYKAANTHSVVSSTILTCIQTCRNDKH